MAPENAYGKFYFAQLAIKLFHIFNISKPVVTESGKIGISGKLKMNQIQTDVKQSLHEIRLHLFLYQTFYKSIKKRQIEFDKALTHWQFVFVRHSVVCEKCLHFHMS